MRKMHYQGKHRKRRHINTALVATAVAGTGILAGVLGIVTAAQPPTTKTINLVARNNPVQDLRPLGVDPVTLVDPLPVTSGGAMGLSTAPTQILETITTVTTHHTDTGHNDVHRYVRRTVTSPAPSTSTTPPTVAQTPPVPVNTVGTGLLWPFEVKSASQMGRTDEGWDLVSTPGCPVLAVASGVVHNPTTADPGGFGYDYAIEHLDNAITVMGRTFQDIYYGHTHLSATGHVNAGQIIAHTGGGGYGRGGDGELGEVEIGFGNPNVGGGISWNYGPIMRAALS